MAGQKAVIQIINKSGNFYSLGIVLKVETAQKQLFQELNLQKNPLALKSEQPGKYVLPCFWNYSYNTRDCVVGEIRTFNFGKNCKQYYPLSLTKTLLRPKKVIYQ